MSRKVRILVMGDWTSDFEPHAATEAALSHVSAIEDCVSESLWLGTEILETMPESRFDEFDGFWAAPGSPYRSLEGALRGIRYARENARPLIGTCAGFQHMVLEFARNVLGLQSAHSEEYEPGDTSHLVVTLSRTCELAGKTMTIRLKPGSISSRLYGAGETQERYYCRFSLNPRYRERLEQAGLRVVGTDETGEARILTLADHPFYLATLFVPQAASRPGRPHPLITAFIKAAASIRSADPQRDAVADGIRAAGREI